MEIAGPGNAAEIMEDPTLLGELDDIRCVPRVAGKMRQLDRLASIGTLSASMAHEIKNAMVPVRTFVDLLLLSNKDAELADVVRRELRRVESIVSQMLKFAGPAKPTFALVRIHEVLEQALQLVQHQLAAHKIMLATRFTASPETVQGDTYQLEQAFLNLFFNAIESMGVNGTLSIMTDTVPALPPGPHPALCGPGAQVRVTVGDTGTGVLPEHVDRLFEPFFTTKPQGTGLGLTITRRIIREHQGTIEVDTRPNLGTTFTLLFPQAAEAHGASGGVG